MMKMEFKVGQEIVFTYTMQILRLGVIVLIEGNELTVWCDETKNFYSIKTDEVVR
jgi:hypothetical protein